MGPIVIVAIVYEFTDEIEGLRRVDDVVEKLRKQPSRPRQFCMIIITLINSDAGAGSGTTGGGAQRGRPLRRHYSEINCQRGRCEVTGVLTARVSLMLFRSRFGQPLQLTRLRFGFGNATQKKGIPHCRRLTRGRLSHRCQRRLVPRGFDKAAGSGQPIQQHEESAFRFCKRH